MKTYPMSKKPKDGDYIILCYENMIPDIGVDAGRAFNDEHTGERLVEFENIEIRIMK